MSEITTERKTWAITGVPGDGYPECEWDFAVVEGERWLKITANCPAAYIELSGEAFDGLLQLLEKGRDRGD